jgi:signal transduction histidine kinase
MRERVAIHGGDLQAGPMLGGGWTVAAQIPHAAQIPLAAPVAEQAVEAPDVVGDLGWAGRVAPWLDRILAAMALVAFEVVVITGPSGLGRSLAAAAVVAAIAVATLWRRRSPLVFLGVVGVLGVCLSGGPIGLPSTGALGGYLVLVPTYAVAVGEERRRAVLGLGIWLIGAVLFDLFSRAPVGVTVGGMAMGSAVWVVGRVVRNQRRLADELRRTAEVLASERHDRTRLAVAAERARIARELHGLVARGIVAMIVQADSARTLLDTDPDAATAALPAIEGAGRDALHQMRQILGALRAPGRPPELEPAPGVDQIRSLVERARAAGQLVELSIEGEPGPTSAGVDLVAHRIVEELLSEAHEVHPDGGISVRVLFRHDLLQLDVAACGITATSSVHRRVAMGHGELVAGDDRVIVRLPRVRQVALS